jgi:hypothetical protein
VRYAAELAPILDGCAQDSLAARARRYQRRAARRAVLRLELELNPDPRPSAPPRRLAVDVSTRGFVRAATGTHLHWNAVRAECGLGSDARTRRIALGRHRQLAAGRGINQLRSIGTPYDEPSRVSRVGGSIDLAR